MDAELASLCSFVPLWFNRSVHPEGTGQNTLTGRSFPLTPTLSPSAGERENLATAMLFCRPSWSLRSMKGDS